MQQQLERKAYAETRDVRGYVREPAAAGGGREIDVRPGNVLGHEAVEEARGENVIALALERALHDVGDPALEVLVEVLLEGKVPDALAAHAARLDQQRR